jgi:sigma-54-specific transcriptional regulator
MQILSFPNTRALALSIRATALVFEDPESRALLNRIEQVAPSRANVLIIGETGTGKELVARHVHALGPCPDGPFVAVNCGALSETLVEAELFGHERGAFTGATQSKPGWFEAAHGGTLFLDEIGDLPLAMQVKLLRVLQEREVTRVGARHAIPIDVRLVAATNVRLEETVRAGRFREDLYYRLNVAKLALRPLRERPGDILPLARHFVHVYAQRLDIGEASLGRDAEGALLAHPWPGNIRELENVIHHALLVCTGQVIAARDLSLTGGLHSPAVDRGAADRESGGTPGSGDLRAAILGLLDAGVPDLHARVDDLLIRTAFEWCDRNQLQTARVLGVSRNVLRARLQKLGLIGGGRRSASGEAESVMPADAATVD